MSRQVKILCGISGSGKSTLTEQIICTTNKELTICSADQYFMMGGEYRFNPGELPKAHAECLRNYVHALQQHKDLVVVDNTNTTVAEVAPYAALAQAYGYDLEVIILEADVEMAHARNVHGVPLAVIQGQANRLEDLVETLPPWWRTTVRQAS